MMFFRPFVLAVVFTVGVADTKSTTLVTKTKTNHKTILEIRGGAGPLDPETTVKVLTTVAGLQGVLMNVAPKLTSELYGLKENTDSTQYFMRQCGTGVLSYALMSYCLFVKKTSIYTAIQAATAFWIYEHLRNILNGDVIKGGYKSMNGEIFALASDTCTFFAMTQDYAETAIKATSVLWGLIGFQCFLAPKSAGTAWQFDANKGNATTKMLCRLMGCYLMAYSAFIGSIAFCGSTNLQAVGYGSFAWALFHAAGILSGEFKTVGMDMLPHLFWLLFYATLIGTALL
jgi:hypothetical protein